MTPIDRFQGQRLTYNDTITYRTAFPGLVNPNAPPQPETDTPYTAHIVDFTDTSIGVRSDGFGGKEPLYYVFPSSIVSVIPQKQARRTHHP